MLWRNEIIIADKQNKAIAALLHSLLLVGIFIAIWNVTPFVMGFTAQLDSYARGRLFRVVVTLCMTPIFLAPLLMVFKSYKIDLFNDELTTSNDILFWTTQRTEKITGRRYFSILDSSSGIHSKELRIEVNGKTITISKQLHSSVVGELSNFLEQHRFEKARKETLTRR
tara:strand:+ start:1763 stop:2269 length:507 start_codon:yes stop_codon:yes gene_type:complete